MSQNCSLEAFEASSSNVSLADTYNLTWSSKECMVPIKLRAWKLLETWSSKHLRFYLTSNTVSSNSQPDWPKYFEYECIYVHRRARSLKVVIKSYQRNYRKSTFAKPQNLLLPKTTKSWNPFRLTQSSWNQHLYVHPNVYIYTSTYVCDFTYILVFVCVTVHSFVKWQNRKHTPFAPKPSLQWP